MINSVAIDEAVIVFSKYIIIYEAHKIKNEEPVKEEPAPLDMSHSRGPTDAAAIKAASLKKSLEVVDGQMAFSGAHAANHKSTSDTTKADVAQYKEAHHNKVLDPKEFS